MLEIVTRKVSELIPYVFNSRTHSDEQVAQIAASIREFGWTNPILIDPYNGIIAGHGRLLAARKLGQETVPVIELAGLTEAQKRAYIIADNKLALNAGWDIATLSSELKALDDRIDLSLTGFSPIELKTLMDYIAPNQGLTDENETPPVPDDPVTVLGDMWILGKHRLICGDSTVVTVVDELLDGVQPHLMVTDPPYGVEYDPQWRAEAGVNKNKAKMGAVKNDDRSDWREAWALFTGDVAYVWHAGRHASSVQASLESAEFSIRCQIIWAKDRLALSRGDYHWQHEPCWYAVRKAQTGHWTGDRKQTTLWRINGREDKGHGHSTQKPVECMRRPIENNSSPGQAVYEPFSGSGTTIIAAEQTGRCCYAIELSPAYCDVAIKRWQDFSGGKAIHAKTGQPFDSVPEIKDAAAA